jgi:UDP-glucose:(heptosyl)LPS alpha-1,3-glucosyltransferase
MNSYKPAKVAVIIPKYGLLGGAEEHTAEITNRIAQRKDFDVHVFANKWTNDSENITFHKIPIITFPKFLTTISFAYFSGLKTSPFHFDIIHTHDRVFQSDICTLHGIPHRTWVRDVRKKRMPSLFDLGTMWVDCKCAENSKAFIAVSSLTKEKFLEENRDVEPDKVKIIYPGVNVEDFSKLDGELCRHQIRRQFGISLNDVVVLFVSMNYDIKGLDYLMSGLAQFLNNHKDQRIKLLVVGKSSQKKYDLLAKQLGIYNNIIYTGVVERDLVPRFYKASDIYAMPSRFDTFGLTVLEAMAASLPVIISTNVGAKDCVRHGENGFIVNNGNGLEGICSALELLCNPDIRNKFSNRAFETALNYSWDKNVDQHVDLYHQLLLMKSRAKQSNHIQPARVW